VERFDPYPHSIFFTPHYTQKFKQGSKSQTKKMNKQNSNFFFFDPEKN